MMFIDMTSQLGSLLIALDVILVFTATVIAVNGWQTQRASFASHRNRTERESAVVDTSSSAPAPAGVTPSDTSLPEAA